ncbi:FAD-dependent oxidoreductase [Rugosimonospora africana]|uniref:3-(3-hydroxyphenyl)propionate hydroxylase n=1 Tax=Rugosimonospora africana TaxID=556532 RepID=A0A8J3R0B0_9ACTN|nr:FAD-dependent oxidoreductase [Rugosimonospora africana]GIH19307.1 3-(3-hydroxyphenyl)propionate hydroxylase [Rugosimonospora africana]
MPEVIISGAGPAGLTLAIELARRDVDFLLIDKAPGPFIGSRGKGIQPRTLEIFEDLGVLDRMVAGGGEYPAQRVYTDDGPVDRHVMERQDPSPAEPYRNPLMLPQFRTESVLRDRLAEFGHAPRYRHELLDFEDAGGGVTARFGTPDGESTARVAYLVGTDGGSSLVRKTLAIGYPGKTLGVRAFVADVHVDGLCSDAWHTWHEGTPRQIAMCPLAGTDLFQFQGGVPLDGEVDTSADGLTTMLRERTGSAGIVVRDVRWASVYLMGARLADAYRAGRVYLAGDAAHVHPPTGGQGLNTSIQDAYNLGWKLASVLRGAPESLLDSYEQERRPIAESVLGLSTRLLDEAARRGMRRDREAQQLDLGYPLSPLAGPGELAGYRAPDAPLTGAGGQPVRLFQLLAGPQWTLVGYGVPGTPQPRAGLRVHTTGLHGDIVDSGGHLRSAYALSPGDWVLVRPDGYVALVTADFVTVESYLDRVGLFQPRNR